MPRGFFIATYERTSFLEDAMPLPTFLLLIASVIVAAGMTLAVFQFVGLSLVWLGVLALGLALGVRALKWH